MPDSRLTDTRKREGPKDRSLFRMIVGPTIWSVHFLLTYGTTAIVCAKPWASFLTGQLLILGYTLAALVAIGLYAWGSFVQWDYLDDLDYIHEKGTDEDRREFLGHTGFLLSALSFVAVIYVALPAIFIRSCL